MVNDNELTVSELTSNIKDILNQNISKKIKVVGEISNLKLSKDNVFFTLKDGLSSISSVIWEYNKKTNTQLENGQKIKVVANVIVFTKSGTYNLNILTLEVIGDGQLHQDYLQLKEKFTKMGYFDKENKKLLPPYINNIGVVTASSGAALQDFFYIINQNKFLGNIIVQNCVVQGKECPPSVIKGLLKMDKSKLDVIVLTRGGGSFEDLYGFSNSKVVETVYKLKTPIISAIGHEVDFMLTDFVADVRAPTPSLAGEIISSINNKYLDNINILYNTVNDSCQNKITMMVNKVDKLSHKINSLYTSFHKVDTDIDQLMKIVDNKIVMKSKKINQILQDIGEKLDTLCMDHPIQIYSYGIPLMTKGDFMERIKKKKRIVIKFSDGSVQLFAKNIVPLEN